MKAITIKQPWASLIVAGIKPIENRTWYTKLRDRVYIHTSAKPSFHNLVLNLWKGDPDKCPSILHLRQLVNVLQNI